jgi:hypothetical protein
MGVLLPELAWCQGLAGRVLALWRAADAIDEDG